MTVTENDFIMTMLFILCIMVVLLLSGAGDLNCKIERILDQQREKDNPVKVFIVNEKAETPCTRSSND